MTKRPKKTVGNGATLDEAVDTFLQGAGKISSALLGMINKVGGQIYALLFLSDEPLSLDEIADRLSVSKSNVSINIRLLEEYDLVKQVWVRGSRKDYYAAQRAYPKKVITDFLEKIQGTLSDAITTIERTRAKTTEARVVLTGKEKKRADYMMQQLNLMGMFYYAANQFFDDFFAGKKLDEELLRRVIQNPEDFHKGKEE
jgi:DNA-binding transcriptional regulator GbsR (MarR family)